MSTERHELKMAKKQVDDELELKAASLTELEGMLQKVRKEAAKNTEKAQTLAHDAEERACEANNKLEVALAAAEEARHLLAQKEQELEAEKKSRLQNEVEHDNADEQV